MDGLIGALHAVPIALMFALTGRSTASIWTVLIMIGIAVSFGSDAFMFTDLFFVGLAAFLGWQWTDPGPTAKIKPWEP